MTHALKTWPEFYRAVESGEKTFEIRKKDRPFEVGETLLLQEWDNETKAYTGNELKRRITYVLNGNLSQFGLVDGFCIMGIEEIEQY